MDWTKPRHDCPTMGIECRTRLGYEELGYAYRTRAEIWRAPEVRSGADWTNELDSSHISDRNRDGALGQGSAFALAEAKRLGHGF